MSRITLHTQISACMTVTTITTTTTTRRRPSSGKRKGRILATSKIVVILMLTFSSTFFRETKCLVSGWTTSSRNGSLRCREVSRVLSVTNSADCSRLSFSRRASEDRLRLYSTIFQKETIGRTSDGGGIQNRSLLNNRQHVYATRSMVSRNFSTGMKAAKGNDGEMEYDVVNIDINPSELNASLPSSPQSNDTFSSDTKDNASQSTVTNGNERLMKVLSIDPEDIDVYERAEEAMINSENQEDILSGNPFGNRNFIEMFRGSANYIASHRNSLAVFHIPGDLMEENPDGFRDLMNDISLTWLLGMRIVIVAGCRFQINKRLSKRHKEDGTELRKEHMGMVVTDEESLRIVKEEAGYVRFEVERQLARALKSRTGHRNNNGQVGEGNVVSGNFYSAQPFGVLDGVDYKYSGFVRRLETNKIHQVHQNRDIVLLTSLGFSPTGEVFNVNSEYLAAFAAGSLDATKVIYFLEKNTALRHKIHGSDIPHLRVNDGRNLLDKKGVRTETKGFVYVHDSSLDQSPEQLFLIKMGWGMKALEAGVKRVHLISPYHGALLQELYTRDGSGTMISGDLYDGIHPADVNDVNAIFDVITPLVKKGILVERPKAILERDIDQYHVYTRDGLLIACGQMKTYEDGYAEFGCLVVNPLYRAKGRGDAMLGYLERLCVQNGATNLFVLSTQTMEWFVERGFSEVGVESLPPSRQATYNHERASKIYMKKVTSLRDLDASELFWDR